VARRKHWEESGRRGGIEESLLPASRRKQEELEKKAKA